MELEDKIPAYLAYCENQKQLDHKTRKAYRIDLYQLAGKTNGLDMTEITPDMLENIYASYHQAFKPKTVKRKIASAKAYFGWLEEKEYIEENPFHKVHTKFREPKVLPRTIPEHNLELFLQALYDNKKEAATKSKKRQAVRDIAIIELLFGTGIRISELCMLKDEDINLTEGEVLIYGKGRKERLIQVPDTDTLKCLADYRKVYQAEIGKSQEHYFFVNDRGNPISDVSVRNLIQKYAKKAGITQHITPHMFRHTFATSLVDRDVNLRCIQEILGHSSISTTELYTHVSAAKQRQVLSDCHPRKQLNIRT